MTKEEIADRLKKATATTAQNILEEARSHDIPTAIQEARDAAEKDMDKIVAAIETRARTIRKQSEERRVTIDYEVPPYVGKAFQAFQNEYIERVEELLPEGFTIKGPEPNHAAADVMNPFDITWQ